jgi:hypothetical protein
MVTLILIQSTLAYIRTSSLRKKVPKVYGHFLFLDVFILIRYMKVWLILNQMTLTNFGASSVPRRVPRLLEILIF